MCSQTLRHSVQSSVKAVEVRKPEILSATDRFWLRNKREKLETESIVNTIKAKECLIALMALISVTLVTPSFTTTNAASVNLTLSNIA